MDKLLIKNPILKDVLFTRDTLFYADKYLCTLVFHDDHVIIEALCEIEAANHSEITTLYTFIGDTANLIFTQTNSTKQCGVEFSLAVRGGRGNPILMKILHFVPCREIKFIVRQNIEQISYLNTADTHNIIFKIADCATGKSIHYNCQVEKPLTERLRILDSIFENYSQKLPAVIEDGNLKYGNLILPIYTCSKPQGGVNIDRNKETYPSK